MAKFHSTTFGAISGKHGTAVAVTRKDGTSYLRVHVKAHNPRTDKQQAHRAKFALTSKALAPFNSIFKHTMGVTNGISIARSHAFRNAIVNEYPNFSIDYKKIMFSFGTLEKLQNASTTSDNGVVSINWDFKKMYNCHGNDSVSLVVFNKDTNQALHIENIASRKDRQTKINIQESWANSEIYFWAYVRRGDKISDSVAVGANQHSPNIANQHSSNIAKHISSNITNNCDNNDSNNISGCDAVGANQHSPNVTNQHSPNITKHISPNITNQHSPNITNNHDNNDSNNVSGCDAKWAKNVSGCDSTWAKNVSPLRRVPSKTIGSVIRAFKIGVTKWIRQYTNIHTSDYQIYY